MNSAISMIGYAAENTMVGKSASDVRIGASSRYPTANDKETPTTATNASVLVEKTEENSLRMRNKAMPRKT